MKLEVGKKYVCRSDGDVKYVRIDAIRLDIPDHTCRVVTTTFYHDGRKFSRFYGVEGNYLPGHQTSHDLVAEYVEPRFVVDKCGIYRARNGGIVKVVGIQATGAFPVLAVYNDSMTIGFTTTRQRYRGVESSTDLVEYIRPLTQEDFE